MIVENRLARMIRQGIEEDHTPNEIARQILQTFVIKEKVECFKCYDKGKIPTTGSALLFPDRFPNEFMQCPVCKGLPKAIGTTESHSASGSRREP